MRDLDRIVVNAFEPGSPVRTAWSSACRVPRPPRPAGSQPADPASAVPATSEREEVVHA